MPICSAAWTLTWSTLPRLIPITVTVDQTLDENYLAMVYTCPEEIKAKDPEAFAALVSPESHAIICKKEFRQAIAYAIDYDGIIQAVLNGLGRGTQHHPGWHCGRGPRQGAGA